MSDLRYLEYDPNVSVLDAILGKESAEDMKRLGEKLSAVSKRFSEWKQKLTKEHKQEIFERIGEIRASHQLYWGRRNQAWERNQEQRGGKRSEFESRVRQNIADNYERLAKAQNAADRCAENIASNYAKLADAKSADFAERVREWISQDEDRLDDIKTSIRRIREWISEGESKLR
jgi:hypothetical protein